MYYAIAFFAFCLICFIIGMTRKDRVKWRDFIGFIESNNPASKIVIFSLGASFGMIISALVLIFYLGPMNSLSGIFTAIAALLPTIVELFYLKEIKKFKAVS